MRANSKITLKSGVELLTSDYLTDVLEKIRNTPDYDASSADMLLTLPDSRGGMNMAVNVGEIAAVERYE